MTDAIFTGKDVGLEAAIDADDRRTVAAAIADGAGANARGRNGTTPLMVAVDRLKQNAVAELLARGGDPNLKAEDGSSAVSLAVEAYRSNSEILFLILRNGGDPNTRRPDNDPVIMRFVNDRNCEYLGHMNDLGANLDITTRAGDPIITAAAVGQDWDVVWCLIELGAAYDYEHTSRLPISESLAGDFPAPDSPIYPYKAQVWELFHSEGIAVPPLNR